MWRKIKINKELVMTKKIMKIFRNLVNVEYVKIIILVMMLNQ